MPPGRSICVPAELRETSQAVCGWTRFWMGQLDMKAQAASRGHFCFGMFSVSIRGSVNTDQM